MSSPRIVGLGTKKVGPFASHYTLRTIVNKNISYINVRKPFRIIRFAVRIGQIKGDDPIRYTSRCNVGNVSGVFLFTRRNGSERSAIGYKISIERN